MASAIVLVLSDSGLRDFQLFFVSLTRGGRHFKNCGCHFRRTAAARLAGPEVEEGGANGGTSQKRKTPQCPAGMLFDDFDPLPLLQKASLPSLEFETFDAALDEFYSKARPPLPTLFHLA